MESVLRGAGSDPLDGQAGTPSKMPGCLCLWPLPVVTKWGPEEEGIVSSQNQQVSKQLWMLKGLPRGGSRRQKVLATPNTQFRTAGPSSRHQVTPYIQQHDLPPPNRVLS